MDKDISKYITKNYYENKDVKKYMPKLQDEQLKNTGIPLTNHILLVGGTGSGKSNTFINFLSETMEKPKTPSFKTIHMLIRKVEPFNLFLKEKLGNLIFFYTKIEDFPSVNDFQELNNKNSDCHLIVFDDFITDKNSKNVKKIEDYLIYGRGRGCQVILLSQSFYQTNILLRKQVSFLILCGINGKRDLLSILKDYAMDGIDFKQLKRMYEYAKKPYKDEPTFLKIQCTICPLNKKFSKYWLMYLNPNDF